MSVIGLEQLRRHVHLEVQRALEHEAGRRRPWVGLVYRGRPGWTGEATFDAHGFRFQAVAAQSLLALRCLLSGRDPQQPQKLVVVANLEQPLLPADIRARLLRPELLSIEPWQVLMAEFQAVRIDARIAASQELAIALLQHRPPQGYAPVSAGVLDLATCCGALCRHALGLPSEEPTAGELLRWSCDEDAGRRLRAAPEAVVTQAIAWLRVRQPLAALLLGLLRRISAADLLPLGLVCEVLYHADGAEAPELLRAQGRLEQHLGGTAVTAAEARAWAAEALRTLRQMEGETQRRLRKRADVLLSELGATGYASLSVTIPSGYEGRLLAFQEALTRHLSGAADDATLLAAVAAVTAHWDSTASAQRRRRVEMAARLARWLRTPEETPSDLAAAATHYRDQLSFADWARQQLVGGDPLPELQRAYAALQERVLERRQRFNRAFGEQVAAWSKQPERQPGLLRIEEVVPRLVAPLAAAHRVLVLVMDGMSWAVAQELLTDIERGYWTLRRRTEAGLELPAPVLATVPSVTEFSRASLLCGHLCRGNAEDERRGFAEQPGLREASNAGWPPRLFHAAELEEPGRQGLAARVAEALADLRQRVVGVVVNAVDDHLAKDDGSVRTWSVEAIRVLGDLLQAAKDAKRAVVLCADHGHVLGHWVDTHEASGEGGERWRTGTPGDGEVTISGPRLTPWSVPQVVTPWSETVRYGIKKNGYHGGVAPQELIAPCVVLAQMDDEIEGWHEVPRCEPGWWSLLPPAPAAASAPVVRGQSRPMQQELPLAGTAGGGWIPRLLASPQYQAQARLAGRRRPDDATVQRALAALDAAPGSQLAEQALAEVLGMPRLRVRGIVAELSRLLNVDGYRILGYTDDGLLIRLDRQLALQQFGLERGAP